MPRFLLRRTALLLIFAYCGVLATRCASFGGATETSDYSQLEAAGPEVPPAPADFIPIRIVLLNFRNAADVTRFDVIPDGDYSEYIANAPPTETPQDSETQDAPQETETTSPAKDSQIPADSAQSDARDAAPEPNVVDTGAVAREITETTLFQSGRFEVVPEFTFRSKMDTARAAGQDETAAVQSAARDLGVQYIIYGSLTDFEIRQQQEYWKLPLWAILLVGSFFIQDKDLRNFVWYAMIRIALVAPLNSPVWDYGIQWNDLDLNVDVGMDLRIVDALSGSVVYSDSKSVTRVENVRNLNLMVWSSNRRIKITQSNAGRQIRYVARELVRDLAGYVDAGQLSPTVPVSP